MTDIQQHTNQFDVKISGSPVPPALAHEILHVVVDNSLNMPDVAQVSFRDPGKTILDTLRAEVGVPVKIGLVTQDAPGGTPLFDGEITSLEIEYDEFVNATVSTIRAYDKSHRLFAGRSTKAFVNMTFTDIVKKVAGAAGIPIGKSDPTTTVHEHMTQANLCDWDFLRALADEVGYELTCVEGKLNFTKPRSATAGPTPGGLERDTPLALTLGSTLIRFRASVTGSEQIASVEARSWDPKAKQAITGTASVKPTTALVQDTPSALARHLKASPHRVTHVPLANQGSAASLATAVADRIAGVAIELEGVARGNPALKAGVAVSLGAVPKRFEGKYVLTSTRHISNHAGYTVAFTVSGREERSMLGLTSGGLDQGGEGMPPIAGVVPAIVTNNNDPQRLTRVKVKFPWLDGEYESGWARVATFGAGKDRGGVMIPEVNDEVLVAFEQGDPRRPFVIGSLYNGKDNPKMPGDVVKAGRVTSRSFVSRVGHKIELYDDDAKQGVFITTAAGQKIEIQDKPQPFISVEARSGMAKVKMDGTTGNIDVDSKMNVTIKAATRMELKATAGISIDGGALVEVKGAIVKLN